MTNTAKASHKQLLGIGRTFLTSEVLLSVSLTALLSFFYKSQEVQTKSIYGCLSDIYVVSFLIYGVALGAKISLKNLRILKYLANE